MRRRLTVTNGSLFGSAPKPIKLNSTVHPEAVPRLSRQCELILARLKEGPASNDELCRMARKYTSRLSDLRKSGFTIEAFDLNHATGICWYKLKGEK